MGLRRLTGKEGRRIITTPSVTGYLRGSDCVAIASWCFASPTNHYPVGNRLPTG